MYIARTPELVGLDMSPVVSPDGSREVDNLIQEMAELVQVVCTSLKRGDGLL
jgi:hypothetical protein